MKYSNVLLLLCALCLAGCGETQTGSIVGVWIKVGSPGSSAVSADQATYEFFEAGVMISDEVDPAPFAKQPSYGYRVQEHRFEQYEKNRNAYVALGDLDFQGDGFRIEREDGEPLVFRPLTPDELASYPEGRSELLSTALLDSVDYASKALAKKSRTKPEPLLRILGQLIDEDARLNDLDASIDLPFTQVVRNTEIELIQLFLDHGLSLKTEGKSPAQLETLAGLKLLALHKPGGGPWTGPNVLQLFLDRGADYGEPIEFNRRVQVDGEATVRQASSTYLIYSTRNTRLPRWPSSLETLLDADVAIDAVDSDGKSAWDHALEIVDPNRRETAKTILMEHGASAAIEAGE